MNTVVRFVYTCLHIDCVFILLMLSFIYMFLFELIFSLCQEPSSEDALITVSVVQKNTRFGSVASSHVLKITNYTKNHIITKTVI